MNFRLRHGNYILINNFITIGFTVGWRKKRGIYQQSGKK